MADLPDWGASQFASEFRDLDAVIDDHDIDRWNKAG